MVLTPSLLLPGASSQVTDTVLLIAIFAAGFVIVEYAATSPGLVEFRGAPPLNRIRFATLWAMLLLIGLACRGIESPSTLGRLVQAVGLLLGQAMDIPLSPVRLLLWLLPDGVPEASVHLVRMAAGLAYLVALVGLTVFAIVMRARNWPAARGTFNVWTNLPTFDPVSGGDVVARLNRDGAVNIGIGLVLPYLAPPVVYGIARLYSVSMLDSPLLLVWVMSAWAFLPASLILRGIAMRRLARTISERRVAAGRAAEDSALSPA